MGFHSWEQHYRQLHWFCSSVIIVMGYIDGLVQDCSNSALTMKLLQSCTINITRQPLLGLLSWYPVMYSSLCGSFKDWASVEKTIGRTVLLLKPPQSPHCYLGEVDHARKNSPPNLAPRQARSYRANWATQTLLYSKPLDLAQVCHGNEICSKPVLTWKLTLVLAFPAHCISN